ncbi:AlpA family transcriptional regulator [Achromobacter phage vB_AchrS_AchV4]|uniref:AlpA family transcriptional regulator n=1 Tax=Achromobacter phage vB_AchrS_AchV4 TaxID=2796514 RepID=A0A7T3PGZ4_9CAUD|nr:excisionase and transcriptional regulator [Achromobacter phage vB_AchrS_AchV4]QPZ53313.1 AlpA family transcriptional regulator [Achromobacter phage vB_AchrS_AchV4]
MSDVKFLRLPEVRDRVGMSRSQIYKLIQQGDFPAPVKLGARVSIWPDPEVRAWQEAKLAAAGRSAA